ncbi:MAG: hypothetical protein R2771_15960 [Saprospiraceae bacterium]
MIIFLIGMNIIFFRQKRSYFNLSLIQERILSPIGGEQKMKRISKKILSLILLGVLLSIAATKYIVTTTQVSDNSVTDLDPQIDGDSIVWESLADGDYDI